MYAAEFLYTFRRGTVGARHASPAALHTQKWRGVRLPLEGKLAQRQLRLMRSKRSIIAISWYDAVTFDLIRHGQWPVTPSPPGEGFSLSHQSPASIFYCSGIVT